MTALHWLLASCGEEFEVLEVYCDESKPIQEGHDFFDVFIGRKDKLYLRFGDKPSPSFIYNLAGPINLVDSKVHPAFRLQMCCLALLHMPKGIQMKKSLRNGLTF